MPLTVGEARAEMERRQKLKAALEIVVGMAVAYHDDGYWTPKEYKEQLDALILVAEYVKEMQP